MNRAPTRMVSSSGSVGKRGWRTLFARLEEGRHARTRNRTGGRASPVALDRYISRRLGGGGQRQRTDPGGDTPFLWVGALEQAFLGQLPGRMAKWLVRALASPLFSPIFYSNAVCTYICCVIRPFCSSPYF